MMTFIASIRDDDDEHIVVHIYDLYFERMKKQAYDILHNHADADDAVQATLISISLHPSRFEALSEAELRAMLRICVRNNALKIYNQNKRRDSMITYYEDIDMTIDARSADDDTPAQIVSDKQFALEISELIGRLPPVSQDLLTLSVFYGMRNTDIADLLGMDAAKVNTYLQRARRKLQGLIAERTERKEDEDSENGKR